MIYNRKPYISFIRIFGSKPYVHVPRRQRRGIFTRRAETDILLEYDDGGNYRVLLDESKKVVISCDVTIDEESINEVEHPCKIKNKNVMSSDSLQSLTHCEEEEQEASSSANTVQIERAPEILPNNEDGWNSNEDNIKIDEETL